MQLTSTTAVFYLLTYTCSERKKRLRKENFRNTFKGYSNEKYPKRSSARNRCKKLTE